MWSARDSHALFYTPYSSTPYCPSPFLHLLQTFRSHADGVARVRPFCSLTLLSFFSLLSHTWTILIPLVGINCVRRKESLKLIWVKILSHVLILLLYPTEVRDLTAYSMPITQLYRDPCRLYSDLAVVLLLANLCEPRDKNAGVLFRVHWSVE